MIAHLVKAALTWNNVGCEALCQMVPIILNVI